MMTIAPVNLISTQLMVRHELWEARLVISAQEIFTPNDFPTYTYVERRADDLEQPLRDALATPKMVVSLSGPSKSGKTVLLRKVVGTDNLIEVSGAEIRTSDDLWNRVLDWMGAPSQVSDHITQSESEQGGLKASGSIQIPFAAKIGGTTEFQATNLTSQATTTTIGRRGLPQVVREIADSNFVLLIDDFHYMPREAQADAARQIKAAAERGVRICVASVPHRADDVVRGNAELRGRTINLDTSFWTVDELTQIATKGFPQLNVDIAKSDANKFAEEACGSPQLMQAICLNACLNFGIRVEQQALATIELADSKLRDILQTTSLQANYSSLVRQMHLGPKIRGVERKEFNFKDGSTGDVYRCLLLAIAQDPPAMDLPYPDLMNRIAAVCGAESPSGSSVKEACKQMVGFALATHPTERIIEFDDDAGNDILSIVDPYWLFYLRSSDKLAILGK